MSLASGVPSEYNLIKQMSCNDYLNLLQYNLDKIEEQEKALKEQKTNGR